MNTSITLKVRKDGWVSGTSNGFEFTALVYSEGSENGINEGRVSKLFMTENKKPVVTYDREWLKEADTRPAFVTYLKVLNALESLPV